MQAQTFHHNGHELAYYTAGSQENPPLILVHGYTSSHAVWRQTIPVLQDDFYCVALDLLGHGESDVVADGNYSIDAQGRRVLALTDYLGFERFSLIGHSMGGQISMYIASVLAPQRIEKLINVDGVASAHLTPFVEENAFKYIEMMHDTPLAPFFEFIYRLLSPRFKLMATYQFASWFYDMDTMLKDFDSWRIDRNYATRHGIRFVWYHCMNAIRNQDLRPHLGNIQAETLTIFGDKDNTVPVSDAYVADEHIPGNQLVLITDCGHFPMYEKTGDYLTAVRQFMSLPIVA